jgi:hypothetical protein
MADTLESTGNYLPKDLRITAQPDAVDKDKFKVVATGLKISEAYVFQFQYVFEDGSVSQWSPGFPVLTDSESVPSAPSVSVSSTGSGVIPVTLNTFPTNAKRVDVYVIGGVYGSGKVAYSFLAAGAYNIPAAAGSYQVVLLTVTPSSINGDPTSTFNVTVTDPTANLQVDPSVTPSTPTVSSVLGAIQLSWNGKTASGGDQPNGFVAAKVYVGTTSDFTPVDTGQSGANQVDVLNFGNGQNTLNIAVGTIVSGIAMTYGTNYYVKIKTTNGNSAQDSTAVLATGSPAQIGKVGSGDIVSITADQITTGTISSQVVTVGSSTGKHVKLSGTGDPITIYGTGGTSDPLLSFSTNGSGQSVLSIKGSGTFSGDISAATGTLTNALNIGTYNLVTWGGRGYPFSVNSSGNVEANSGKIGGWTINTTQLISTASSGGQIALYPITGNGGKIALIKDGAEKITIDAVEGIVGPTVTKAGNTGPAFKIDTAGNAQFRGDIYADSGIFSGTLRTGTSGSYVEITSSRSNEITFYSSGGSGSYPGVIYADTSNGAGLFIRSPRINGGSAAPYINMYQSIDGFQNALILQPGSRDSGSYLSVGAPTYAVDMYVGAVASGSRLTVRGDVVVKTILKSSAGYVTTGLDETNLNAYGVSDPDGGSNWTGGILRNIKSQTTTVTHNQSASGFIEGTILLVRRA